MNLKRYMKDHLVCLDLKPDFPMLAPEEDATGEAYRGKCKDAVIVALADLFAASGAIRNESKFLKDFRKREKAGTTGIGMGIAIPHIRSMQPREPVMIFARSKIGLEFQSVDDKPVHLFFGLTAPPYQERIYLDLYRRLGFLLQEPWLVDSMMAIQKPGEVIRLLASNH